MQGPTFQPRGEQAKEFVPGVDDALIDLFGWALTPERLAEHEAHRAAWEKEQREQSRSTAGPLIEDCTTFGAAGRQSEASL